MVWHHDTGQKGSTGRLVIQRLNQDMMGVGLPAPISQSPEGTREAHPSIGLLADGGAVVAWESGPRSNRDVRMRYLSSSGLFTSAAIVVNERTSGDQFQPAVTVLEGGTVVVAWTSTGQDSSGTGVYAQRYSALGAKVGGEFRMNMNIQWNQVDPALTSLAGGLFVAVWVSESAEGQTDHGAPNLRSNVMGRLFQDTGQPMAGEYRINKVDALCSGPVVSALGDGFVVAWEQQDERVFSNASDIYVRSFNREGLPAAQEVRWNALAGGVQENPALIVAQGNGLLVWESEVRATNSREVHARMLSGGAEFRVNQQVNYNQYQPAVGADGLGNYVVAWVDFIKPRNSVLTAMQFSQSDKADVTVGNHVSYEDTGTKPLVLRASVSVSQDPVASELIDRKLEQQLTVEFNADEQSRQAALVAQAAAAAKASELLQQMAMTQAPAESTASALAIQDSNVRRTPLASDPISSQGNSGEASSGTTIARTNVLINRRTAGTTILSSQAQASLSGTRSLTPRAIIRRKPVSTNGGGAASSRNLRHQMTPTLPRGMQRLGGYTTRHSTRGMISGSRGNNQRTVGQSSPLRQAQGTATARRLNSTGLATLRSQTTGGSRSMATATSRLNATRSQRMPTQTQARQSRANTHVNASMVRNGAGYQLQWPSRSGSRYQVQKSRDSNNWVNDGPVKRGTGRSINSPISISGQHRYFRVIKSQ
ncbi:MAG: hypothetical protein QF685_12140 [Verrucomicrobiota bacterium]|nr:hypothetical protein [Verrucomicrobiota bacterium]